MRRTTAAFALAAALATPLTAACGQHVVADPAFAPVSTPSSTPTETPAPVVRPTPKPAAVPTPAKDQFLLHNKLYTAGRVAAVECSLPTARLATKQAIIRYASAFVRCLNKAWEPVIRRADFEFVPPTAVHSAPTGSNSECGVMAEDVGAFYCDSDLGIYFNWPDYIVKESYGQEAGRASVQYLIAHEYGHHVQSLTGMATDYAERYWDSKGAVRQGEEDRNEMQAHCFAAAFFGANQKTLRLHGDRLAQYGHPGFRRSEIGDNFPRWLGEGFKAKAPGACNTWAAPVRDSKIK